MMKEKMQELLEETKENKLPFLRMDLQAHAEKDEDDGGQDDNKDQKDDLDNPGDDKKEDKKEEKPGKENPGKTFTQDDVNNIAAKEAKKATEKILKQLGVTDFKTAKEGLDKYQEIVDAQKTDAQKAAEKAQGLEKRNNELQDEVKSLTAQLSVLKAGVNPDSINDVVVLANNLVSDDVDMDKAVAKVLKKYPHFKAEAKEDNEEGKERKPKFSKGEHKGDDKPDEMTAWKNAFKF